MNKTPGWLAAALLVAVSTTHAADLSQVYQLAADQDRGIRAARADLEAVREAVPQSAALLRPQAQLKAGTGFSYADSDTGGSKDYANYNVRLEVAQSLYNRGNRLLQDQTANRVAQAEAGLVAAEQGLVLTTARAYFDVLGAQDNLEFVRAERAAIARQLDQTRERFEVGLIAITDVHEAQARYDLSLAQEIVAANQLDNAREALAEITGAAVEPLARLGEALPLSPPEPADVAPWVSDALRDNPAVTAAQLGVEVAREEVDIRAAGSGPTVDLVGGLSHSDTSGGGSGSAQGASISLQLTMPLTTGGRIESATRAATHELTAARERLEQQQRAVTRQTREAFRNVNAAVSQVHALQQALVSTQSALEATEAGFEVGTRTVVDVLNAQRELFRAQRDLAAARYGYLLSTLSLRLAAGSLTGETIASINALLR